MGLLWRKRPRDIGGRLQALDTQRDTSLHIRVELRTILQSLQGRRLGRDRGLLLYSQFKTTSQLLICSSMQEGDKGTVSLPHGLLLPSPGSRTQLGRSEDRSISVAVPAQAACRDLPQLHGPCSQDNLHQPQRQCKEHRHFCLSSKHLLNSKTGHNYNLQSKEKH